MIKETDDPRKEPARKRAERRWRNYATEKKAFKTAQKEASEKASKELKELRPADIVEGKQDRRGSLVKAQTKFAKDIRAMMEGHAQHTVALYIVSLEARRKRLLVEKLRRLRLAQQEEVRS